MIVTPATASEGLQLAHEIFFQRSADGVTEMIRNRSRRRASMSGVLVAFENHGADGVAGDVTFRAQGLQAVGTVFPCQTSSTLPSTLEVRSATAPTPRSSPR